MATWKVQALSPVEPPKSQVGSSSVHSSFLPGKPFSPSAGTGSVNHSTSQSAAGFRPPAANWSMQLGSRTPLPHPTVGDAVAEGVDVGFAVAVAVGVRVPVTVLVAVGVFVAALLAVGV